MKNLKLFFGLTCLLIFLLGNVAIQESFSQKPGWGKSHHGSHYDQGPRTKPWLMEGIGRTHFPITSSHPDVQKWFDQGNTLLHGFWPFEAERAFRWCIKLDPDCAMAYWGLARCCRGDKARERKFFAEAIKRKAGLSKREQDYLELWEAKYTVQKSKDKARKKAVRQYVKKFDNLLINYPDDIEARALYWLELPGTIRNRNENENADSIRYALDSVLKEVLKKDPDHVGALHYLVHNWDGEEGHFALDSCLHLGKVAPNCGHLQHMPGHVLSSIGLWNEAAIAMDSATRVEKAYMQKRMVLPEQNWDYLHNLDYLAYIQEQLGMAKAAEISCRQLLNGPPPQNMPINLANFSMVRMAIKFEKWEEIVDDSNPLFRWDDDNFIDAGLKAYARCHAYIGLGKLELAEKELRRFEAKAAILSIPKVAPRLISEFIGKGKGKGKPDASSNRDPGYLDSIVLVRRWELQGKLMLARGKKEKGIELLQKAAKLQYEKWRNDPPMDAVFLYNTLREIYLAEKKYDKATRAFEKTLEKIINDGFALSGLVVACQKTGKAANAKQYMGRLASVWKSADRPNRWLERAEACGVAPTKPSRELLAERDYKSIVLDKLGHSKWTAPTAPSLSAINRQGQKVSLEDYRGKNVVLIFYLGGQCLHCMEQIQEASIQASKLKALNTEILAVSKDDLKTLNSYEDSNLGVTLLSDPDFANAKRFLSYDDFEEIELHSTLLIDSHGRVHWSKHGGEPFMDFEFLKNEVRFLNRTKAVQTVQID